MPESILLAPKLPCPKTFVVPELRLLKAPPEDDPDPKTPLPKAPKLDDGENADGADEVNCPKGDCPNTEAFWDGCCPKGDCPKELLCCCPKDEVVCCPKRVLLPDD